MSSDVKGFSSHDTPGYVGFANLPNQVHRKSVKKGFEFTLMVLGESGLGEWLSQTFAIFFGPQMMSNFLSSRGSQKCKQ